MNIKKVVKVIVLSFFFLLLASVLFSSETLGGDCNSDSDCGSVGCANASCNGECDGSCCAPGICNDSGKCAGGTCVCNVELCPSGGGGCDCKRPNTTSLSSPANNSAELPGTSVNLSWNSTGNWKECCDSCNKHYMVRYREQGSSDWINPSGSCRNPVGTSCTLSGLDSCTTYQWKVKPHNGCKGASSYSSVWNFKTNCEPQITYVQNSGNTWVGTSPDDDNGQSCSDNNPMEYEFIVQDNDGAGDVDILQMNLMVSESDSSRNWPLRVMYAKDWDGRASTPTFYVMDRKISTCDKCFDVDQNQVDRGSSNYWCYAVDSHNFKTATSSISLGSGDVVDFLPSNIEVYNEDYKFTLIGSSNSNQSTRISYDPASTTVTANFKIRFESINNNWEGNYKNAWYVRDMQGAQNSSNSAGGTVFSPSNASNRNFLSLGTTSIDFTPPSSTVSPFHKSGSAPDEMHFNISANDTGGSNISGLRSIYNKRYFIQRGDERLPSEDGYYDIPGPDPINVSGSPNTWGPQEYGPDDGFQGGDSIEASAIASDMACNASSGGGGISAIGEEWLSTTLGDVYGSCGVDDPIPTGVSYWVSGHWLGGRNQSACSQTWWKPASKMSQKIWVNDTYFDDNSTTSWYPTLVRIAKKSEMWNTMTSTSNPPDISSEDQQGIILYTGNANLNIPSGTSCNGEKVIFVQDAGVTINPDISVADDSACVLVVQSGVTTVGTGSDKGGGTDEVSLAVISDGVFRVEADSAFDKLQLNGLVFAAQTDFERDLVWEDNQSLPAEFIEYDPRYLYLMKDMLGNKKYQDMECGIVTGSSACRDWDVEGGL